MQCTSCRATLTPVFDQSTDYQFNDSLWVGFHGGYGMFVDNLDASSIWGDDTVTRVLPGSPDHEAVLCKKCADHAVEVLPWLRSLFEESE